jgi:hypothetical protein
VGGWHDTVRCLDESGVIGPKTHLVEIEINTKEMVGLSLETVGILVGVVLVLYMWMVDELAGTV